MVLSTFGPMKAFLSLRMPFALWCGILITQACVPKRLTHTDYTAPSGFTDGIEGPAVDAEGNLYAVNFERQGTIGKVTKRGKASVHAVLPKGSIGNGIRFSESGDMYIADYTGHNVLRIDKGSTEAYVWAHNPEMSQPNDLAIAPNGTIYLSDPNWAAGTGRLWRVTDDCEIELLADSLGTTNGIEVSPDGKYLYFNESVQRKLWRYEIGVKGHLAAKRLLYEWPDFGLDGMRFGPDGNLYVTRYGAGRVEVLNAEGAFVREVPLTGEKPSNLAFGKRGAAYVTMADRGCVERFWVE